ncbi:carbon-nitrogen hydrolase family protein [Meridianimarinicoccus sp. RP-17]|uniref:carbon-nitrogen hydrolase family protein n=1 Tax=Meridianimarinicoccus zhengii TaxID=2056810 RepID=UPI000DABDC77|nr:carbon-nitrogen hydrolase family protein [Phycocomes zhengii]
MTAALRLLACQIAVPPMTTVVERDAHLADAAARVDRALRAAGGADIVVLPELSSIDYSRASFDRLGALAEPLDGPSHATWSALARTHGVHVVHGFPRAAPDGPRICQAVIGPDGGLLGHYDKVHLAQYGASMEKEYFHRGDHLLTFDVAGFRLAPIICYDIRIPELARRLVLGRGADVILHCGAYFRDPSFHTWHPFVLTRALENQCFVVSLNRAGAEYGNSIFCPPWVDADTHPTVFDAHAEEFRLLTLDHATLVEARKTYSFLRDRLDDYGAEPLQV